MLVGRFSFAAEDVVETRDGRLLRGTYIGGSAVTIRLTMGADTQVIAIADIVAVTFGNRAPVPDATVLKAGAAVADVPATGVVVPVGTVVLVRTNDAIDSRAHGNGFRFSATLEGNLVVGQQVIIAKDSLLYGELRTAKQAGRVLGKSELTLVLTGIMDEGSIKPCTSSAAIIAGENQGRDTASKVAAGALVGAAVDGKNGAGKGALVGGAVAVLGRGGSIKLAAGTLLEFRLEQPFTP